MNTIRMGEAMISRLLLALCIGLFSIPALAQDASSEALDAARAAIEQARKAGAEKDAADDLAAASAWLSQAEKARGTLGSLIGKLGIERLTKPREEEVVHLATMAEIKAQTAEAKAKTARTLAQLKTLEKDLADAQHTVAFTKQKLEEAEKSKLVQARAEADLKQIEDSKRRAAQLEAQKKMELEAAREQEAQRAAARERDAENARAEAQRLALMQAKLQALEQEKAMLSAAAQIKNASVKSGEKRIALSIPASNLFGGAGDLSPAGKKTLDSVGEFLAAYPNNKVVVRAYTDNRGTQATALSEKRARRVREYLVTGRGILAARVEAEGLGPADPVATNATDAGRALNRRVEIIVLTSD